MTDDPIRDFHVYDAYKESLLDRLPKCCCCKEPIQEEKAVCIDDEWYCEDCELSNGQDLWFEHGRDRFLVRIDT